MSQENYEPGTELFGDEPDFYRPWQEARVGAAEKFLAIIASTPSGDLMYPTYQNLHARDVSMGLHPLDDQDEITVMQSGFAVLGDYAALDNYSAYSAKKVSVAAPAQQEAAGEADTAVATQETTANVAAEESHRGIELVTHKGSSRVHNPERGATCPWPRPDKDQSRSGRPIYAAG